MFKRTLGNVMEVVQKLGVDPFKISINKKGCDDLLDQAKCEACNQILKRKEVASKKKDNLSQAIKKDNIDNTTNPK